MDESDELIYKRFLMGRNESDLRILLERHKEGLILFLYSYVHDMEDAEDLMLDAFAEVAARDSFAGRSTFRTWLFSIGKNMALMHLRKQKHLLKASDAVKPDAGTGADTEDPPDLVILEEERNRQLYQALRMLNGEYRQILTLIYFEDMSYEEAGRVMGKNRKQTYNLSERGKKALRTELERMGFDYAEYK